MKEYAIWVEGFSIQGESCRASKVATITANSFEEACKKHYKNDTLFDENTLTVWGCKLFDNEKEARKSFG